MPRIGAAALPLLGAAAAVALLAAGWAGAAAGFAAGGLLAAGACALRERRARRRHPGHHFVSAVSHDLRTPLAQIRLLTETLLHGGAASDEERDRWLAAVAREAQVLDDRIANVLLFAHGDGLSPALPLQRTELRALLADLIAAYAPMAEARGMTLRLGEDCRELSADADPRAIRQAVVNLVDNALRFGPEGQTITLSLRDGGGSAVVSVADQGPGMSPDEEVWQPFARADVGAGSAGAGLGLAVVRRVADRHAGRVFVEAAPGGGARVCLSIPTPPV